MLLLLSTPFSVGKPKPDAWLIVLGGADSAISASTTRKDLVDRYGDANVKDQDIDVGEGETEPGTALFPLDRKSSLNILWKDSDKKLSPKSLRISGDASRWKTIHAITLGTSLIQLERINGRPFLLSGFGWDYSGTTLSWKGGVPEKDFEGSGRVILRLDSNTPAGVTEGELNQVSGDRPFSSGHPVMQKINPRVYDVVWLFP